MMLAMDNVSSAQRRESALTEAVMAIVAEHGLDRVSVREVAAAADVSIGTVQHYFPTKERLLAAAYTEAVRRIRDRLDALRLGPDPRANLARVLRQLLPLDERRRTETRVYVAFAAGAERYPYFILSLSHLSLHQPSCLHARDTLPAKLPAGSTH